MGANGTEAAQVRRIAFGQKADWAKFIHANLDARYAPSFGDLARIRLDDFDAVVPLWTTDYDALARRPELLGCKFFHPSPEVVALCDDKLNLTKFLIAEGFGGCVPPLRAATAPYPYVWKRRWGAWGQACYVIGGPDAERDFDLTDEDWLAQSLVHGPWEYATHVLRTGGEIRYVSTVKYKMAGPALIRGERNRPIVTRFSPGCKHLSLFRKILERLGYEGTACFNYKVIRGRPLLFEINPRYGGSLSGDVTAYVDAYLAALRMR